MLHKKHLIVMVQEPWQHGGKIKGKIPGLALHVGPCPQRPRAIVYTSKDLKAWPLVQYSSDDVVAVWIECKRGNQKEVIVFASVYMAHDEQVPPNRMEQLVTFCETYDIPLIVGCDANAHHTAWGSSGVNDRGEGLFSYILGTNLSWENKGNKPTFCTRNRKEVLDLTLKSDSVGNRVEGWHVSDTPSLSDHRYIRFTINLIKHKGNLCRKIRNTNWASYRNVLQAQIEKEMNPPEELHSKQDVELRAVQLTKCMQRAWQESCPLRRSKTPDSNVWWNSDLTRLRKVVRCNLRKAINHGSDEAWDQYQSTLREYKYKVRKAKRQSWWNFCSLIDNNNSLAKVYKVLKGDQTTALSSIKKPNGENSISPMETMEIMLDHHLPERQSTAIDWESQTEAVPLCGLVEDNLARAAVFRCEPYKAPGMDGIYPAMLQQGWNFIRPWLLHIYTASIRYGYIPTIWGESRGCFLPKPGKTNYTETKSYRLITLTSYQLKILERLVLWYLMRIENIDSKLHPRQFGFRKGRSTEVALHHLVSKIENAFANGIFTLGVFLDIEGAFDSITFSVIETALGRVRVSVRLIKWISFMLRHRTLTTTLGDDSITRNITCGCPQGGVLSPLLWNVVVDELLWMFDSQAAYIQAYADDLALLIRNSDLAVVWIQAQHALELAEAWATYRGLKFSYLKTELVLFTNKRKWTTPGPLKLYNNELTLGKVAKYLGVTLDSKLAWTQHIDNKIKHATSCLMQCRRAVGGTWGIQPRRMLWVYTSIIRPIIAYACMIWINALKRKAVINRLIKFQRLACQMITSAYPSTPTAAIEAAISLTPLDLYLKEVAILTAYRLKRDKIWTTELPKNRGNMRSHVWICEQEMENIPTLNMPSDSQTPELVWSLPCETEILAMEEAMEAVGNVQQTDMVCFTDGSVLDGMAGAGMASFGFDPGGQVSFGLGSMATVFQSEVYALQMLTKQLLTNGVQGKTIKIFSDSQATIKALQSMVIKQKSVSECHKLLTELNTQNEVLLQWVPGHVGVPGNELADKRAKEGSKLKIYGPEPLIPISLRACKNAITAETLKEHQNRWSSLDTCRQTKIAIPWLDKQLGRDILSLNRGSLRMVLQAITGHGNLNKHRHTTGQSNTPLCPKCNEEAETSDHYVGRCPAYTLKRILNLGTADTTVQKILQSRGVKRLAQYLKDTGRLSQF